jgi:hypothetical protein
MKGGGWECGTFDGIGNSLKSKNLFPRDLF